MLITLTYNNIFIIAEAIIHILPVCFLQIIWLPVRFRVCLIDIHQRIVRRPPESKKSSAVSIYHQISEIVLRAQGKVLIQYTTFVEFMQIAEGVFCFFCQRAINDLSILVDPPLRACMEFIKNRIDRITGTGTSHQISVTDKADRVFSVFCSHPVFCKCLHDIKCIFQRFGFF